MAQKLIAIEINFGLVEALGYKEAAFLSTLHTLLKTNPQWREGKPWIRKTYHEWIDQLPLFTWDIFKEMSMKLRNLGILLTSEHNKDKRDRTKWYTINYDHPVIKDINSYNIPTSPKSN